MSKPNPNTDRRSLWEVWRDHVDSRVNLLAFYLLVTGAVMVLLAFVLILVTIWIDSTSSLGSRTQGTAIALLIFGGIAMFVGGFWGEGK